MRDLTRLLGLTVWLACTPAPALGQVTQYTTTRLPSEVAGSALVLSRDGAPLDTIDAAFGWKPVRGGVVYRRAGGDSPVWFAADGEPPQPVEQLVPAYRDADAFPSVIDSMLIFWSFAPDPGGGFHVRAIRHDFATGRSDTTNLYSDYLDANNPARYQPPAKQEALVVFRVDGAALWLDAQWSIVRRRGRD